MMEEQVILVDKNDNPIGKIGKLEAHQKGLLHRAISVFVFNSKGEMLLQQRAFNKYHTPGLWSNTACSHPRGNEIVKRAAERRLKEEMGIECDVFYAFNFCIVLRLIMDLLKMNWIMCISVSLMKNLSLTHLKLEIIDI